MTHMKCRHCANLYHWKEAFSKFGYDDGKVETPYVAQILEDAGYAVKYFRWSPHNTLNLLDSEKRHRVYATS